MLFLDKESNLLEGESFDYILQDVKSPNLLRDLYPYNEIPKIAFNHRVVRQDMPESIWITDTTFRDGQQSQVPYTVKQISDLFDMLHDLSGPNGIIRQSEFFVYTKKDREAVAKCLEKGYKFPEVTAWIRASREDFHLAKSLGIKEVGILVSCSDYHIFKKLKMTRKQALERYLSIVSIALEEGICPRCHFEDITRADFYGFVVPFAKALMKLSKESGIPIKIRACDTLGFGTPYTGVTMPRSVPGIISGLKRLAKVPSEQIEWHGHNDFYKAVTNASTAWLYGASAVNCSLLGIGERTGNVPLEAMVFEYASLRGTLDGMNTKVISKIANYFENEIGYEIPPMTPFVGKNFNCTKAGIHADGLLKDEEIYNIFDTDIILDRPVKVEVSKTSGLAGVAFWYNSRYGESLDKNSPIIIHIKEWIDKQYEDGRETSISDSELESLATGFKSKVII